MNAAGPNEGSGAHRMCWRSLIWRSSHVRKHYQDNKPKPCAYQFEQSAEFDRVHFAMRKSGRPVCLRVGVYLRGSGN